MAGTRSTSIAVVGQTASHRKLFKPPATRAPKAGRQSQVIGIVNKVLPQSFVDGPGNRAVVFLQGCNLHCLFCHNPQTLQLCTHCGKCVESCPVGALSLSNGRVQWDMCRCIGCETCIDVCPQFSTPRARRLTSRQLWQEIEPYADYLDGVTVSGGEPLLQPHFVLEWFRLVKMSSSLTTLVETNGCIAVSVLEQLVPVLDYAMVDLKVMDPDLHRRLTGRGNEMTLKAIRFLAARGILQAVRVCVVPDYSDSLENAIETARFLTQLDPHIPLRFLRFRAHGTRGVAETWRSPPDELMDQMVEAARAEGLLDVSRSM